MSQTFRINEHGQQTVGYHGASYGNKQRLQRSHSRIKAGIFDRDAAAECIFSAAGPAAERRFCMETGIPVRTLYAAQGDAEAIEKIIKASVLSNRFAAQEFAWRYAQDLVGRADIWHVIHLLAFELDEIEFEYVDSDFKGTLSSSLPGPTARALIRRAGIRPDSMLLSRFRVRIDRDRRNICRRV